LNMIAPYLYYL